MRYYQLTITGNGGGLLYTSYPNGQPEPNALNISFDLPLKAAAEPTGSGTLTIEGVDIKTISQAQSFYGGSVSLFAGMGGGLPLETPSQKGLIFEGQIFQSFGNWIGTDMALNLTVRASGFATVGSPGNYSFLCQKGKSLADVIMQTLSTPQGTFTPTVHMDISTNWVAPFDLVGVYPTLTSWCQALYAHSATQPNGPINVVAQNGGFHVFDATYKPAPTPLLFTDLIGQPTWVSANHFQVPLVMRGDLRVGSYVAMPKVSTIGGAASAYPNAPGFITTTEESKPSQSKYAPTFSGSYMISGIRQLGNFRSPDGRDWSTVIDCLTSTMATA